MSTSPDTSATSTPAAGTPAVARAGGNGMALASLVVGIVAVVLAVVLNWIGSLVGIVALVLGLVARRRVAGSATAGIVLGAVAIVLGIVVAVALGAWLSSMGMI